MPTDAEGLPDSFYGQRAVQLGRLRAENFSLREALRLAMLWLPDPDMHALMSPGAREQLEQIRAALQERN